MNRNDKPSLVRKAGTSVPLTVVSAPAGTRDFGVLKTRSLKLPQSEAKVFKSAREAGLNFERMEPDRIIQIIKGTNLEQIRELSKYFANTNGIYARAIRYLADLYRYDFMLYPNLDFDVQLDPKKDKKILERFNALLEYFDNSAIQLMARKWTNQICLEGVYYGYICDDINDKFVVQDLPTNYCRSRFYHRGRPTVEFNMKYFDIVTNDDKFRTQILSLYPKEFQDGYKKYKAQKLMPEYQGDDAGYMLLDVNRAFKFNFYDNDHPPFLYAIPSLIGLAETQDLEKEKLIQELQKILVQKFDLDKNGQLPFTMPELQRLNQNAIDMVGDAVGVSVLSTVADVHLEDMMTDGKKALSQEEAAQNGVYNDLGISMNLFNTSGNLALEKSVIVDEAYCKQLLLQFEQFFNDYITWKFSRKESKFRMKMLPTTIFNHIQLSDKYKDLTKLGFSRFLPLVALGHTQKETVSLAKLEQQIMQLDSLMLPPFSSNTMSSDTWLQAKEMQARVLRGETILDAGVNAGMTGQDPVAQTGGNTPQSNPDNTGGRPPLPGDQKSDKTLANQASK